VLSRSSKSTREGFFASYGLYSCPTASHQQCTFFSSEEAPFQITKSPIGDEFGGTYSTIPLFHSIGNISDGFGVKCEVTTASQPGFVPSKDFLFLLLFQNFYFSSRFNRQVRPQMHDFRLCRYFYYRWL